MRQIITAFFLYISASEDEFSFASEKIAFNLSSAINCKLFLSVSAGLVTILTVSAVFDFFTPETILRPLLLAAKR